jgi:hypothetical protein
MNKLKEAQKLLKQQDKAWALAVRKAWDNQCAICHRTKHLNAHHFIPRNNLSTRHLPINGILLCCQHHRFSREISAHQNPMAFHRWLMINHPDLLKQLIDLIDNPNSPTTKVSSL